MLKPSDRARTLPASVVSRADAHALDGGNIHVLLSSGGKLVDTRDAKVKNRQLS